MDHQYLSQEPLDIGDTDRPIEGIAVDASHSVKNQTTEFQAVDLASGNVLFRKNIGFQTVNIGEFLGVVECVKYIIENDFQPRVIYTDSMTAKSWYENRSTASNKRNTDLQKSEIFLLAMERHLETIKVVHWNNRLWGETPADFNRK